MSDRAMTGLTPTPSTRREIERALRNVKHEPDLTPEQRDSFEKEIEQLFPQGFDQRDEANALIAMSVRNGPIENLHAGVHSPLLEDDALSRLTDAEIKAVMIYASRTLALMLWLRDENPQVYRRYVQAYGARYCRRWERAE